jgi:hypothetical protein
MVVRRLLIKCPLLGEYLKAIWPEIRGLVFGSFSANLGPEISSSSSRGHVRLASVWPQVRKLIEPFEIVGNPIESEDIV